MRVRSREAVRGWLNETEWQIATTLTFSNSTHDKAAERLMRHFLGKANNMIFNNAVKKDRGNKRLEVVVIEENNNIGTNFHYHMAMNIPKEFGNEYELFCDFLIALWKENCGNNFIAEFKRASDSTGWIDYITKGIKGDNCDTINLYSSHITAPNSLTD